MDNPFDGGVKEKIFKALGVYDNVEFVKADGFFKAKTGKSDFVMPDGVDEAKAALGEKFPDDRQGIEKYFRLISSIAAEHEKLSDIKWWHKLLFPFIFPMIFRYKKTAVEELLDSIIDNEELKLILNANMQYYHDSADEFSFLYHSVAQYGYYKGGGWYIKGGSQQKDFIPMNIDFSPILGHFYRKGISMRSLKIFLPNLILIFWISIISCGIIQTILLKVCSISF